MPTEVTRSLAWSVKVPAAEDEDESGSPKNPAHAEATTITIIRFMFCALEHAVEGKSIRRRIPGLPLKQQRS